MQVAHIRVQKGDRIAIAVDDHQIVVLLGDVMLDQVGAGGDVSRNRSTVARSKSNAARAPAALSSGGVCIVTSRTKHPTKAGVLRRGEQY